MKKNLLILLLSFLSCQYVLSHPKAVDHQREMLAVLGFDWKARENIGLREWTKFITSDMIDKNDFHKKLAQEYPCLKLAGSGYHRLLFHWPYQTEPWSSDLDKFVREQCRSLGKDSTSVYKDIKFRVKREQKQRNGKINEKTEKVFGFGHQGNEAKFANFFASMAYNIHLLGDQMPDNKEFWGVASVDLLTAEIKKSLSALDKTESKQIIKGIDGISAKYSNPHKRAEYLMLYLKTNVPDFITKARDGSIYRRLKKQGYVFSK